MPKLLIQIDFTDARPVFWAWLPAAITPRLSPLGLVAQVSVAPQPLDRPQGVTVFDNDTLYNFTKGLIAQSPLRQQADLQNDTWFVHVLLTTHHEQKYLGVMYDVGFDQNTRQGCAVFAGEVREVTGEVSVNFNSVILRTVLHEIGHCLNLVHEQDLTIMDQTEDLQDQFGNQWIQHIDYSYSGNDINFVQNSPDSAQPGTSFSNVGILSDTGEVSDDRLSVSLRAFTDRKANSFESGDAVSLLVTLRNKSTEKMELRSPADPHSGQYMIWLKPPGKKYQIVKRPVHGCGIPAESIEIEANKTRCFPIHLFTDNEGYLFATPGRYGVKLSIKQKGGYWAKSRAASFVISKPRNGSKTLKDMVNSAEILQYMMLSVQKKTTTAKISKTLKAHPKSGFSRAYHWKKVYELKKMLHSTKERKEKEKQTRQLLKVYEVLIGAETSGIRKGKLAEDYRKLRGHLPAGKDLDKSIRNYATYKRKSIRQFINAAVVMLVLMTANQSCIKNKVDYIQNNQISGTVTYNDISHGPLQLPSGQPVTVLIDNVESSIYDFKTIDTGSYTFSPTVTGNYVLEFSYANTILQYDSTLVEKLDIDTLRQSSYQPIVYSGSTPAVEVQENDNIFQQNVSMNASETGLQLLITDAQNNPIPSTRVCIYENQTFANQNAPYCGGCVAYLKSDSSGQVLFVGLQPQAYYVNARADLGVVHINNQWSPDQIATNALTAGQIGKKTIVLK